MRLSKIWEGDRWKAAGKREGDGLRKIGTYRDEPDHEKGEGDGEPIPGEKHARSAGVRINKLPTACMNAKPALHIRHPPPFASNLYSHHGPLLHPHHPPIHSHLCN